MALSDVKIRALKPKDKTYRISDAHSLYLVVNPNGSKLWRMNYTFGGKQKTLSFGAYPLVTLLEARSKRNEAKTLLEQKIDPSAAHKAEKNPEGSQADTFEIVGDRWFKTNESRWVSGYAARLRNRMTSDVYPHIGSMPIDTITPAVVLQTVRKVEARGAIEMAKRINQTISLVFRFAIAEGLVQFDPARDITAALAPKPPTKSRAAMPSSEMASLIQSIDDYPGDAITALGLKFVAHTFVRTNELRMAEWWEFEDLDGDSPVWRISADKMKMRRPHIVPLSRQAVAILQKAREIGDGGKWVFPSATGNRMKPMSSNTLIYALYRLGYHSRATVHGFRSTASTVLNENEFNRDWIELQLAHVDASIRGVYNAALYLRQRREMMQWWSDFIEPIDQ